jgi:NADH-quinone oxidoreductase subunit L
VFSVIGGVIGVEHAYSTLLAHTAEGHGAPSFLQQLVYPFTHSPVAALAGLFAAGLGAFLAWGIYANPAVDPLPARLGALSVSMRDRFYFDEFYEGVFVRFHELIAAVADWIDRWLISGLGVRGAHGTTELLGRGLRLIQTGNLQTYAFLFALGAAVVAYLALK